MPFETPFDNRILRRVRKGLMLFAAAMLLASQTASVLAATETEEEVQMGKTSAAEIAKESKFIEDPAVVKRVATIGNAIAAVAIAKEVPATYGKSNVAKFDYSFKIIDDKEINAFALPGGFLYLNKGLLDYVHSDDELAGVIAHEVAHASHHHIMALLRAQHKENTAMALAVLLGWAIGAKTETIGDLAYALTLIRIAKMSSYGQDAEYDADRTAVAYLAETKYNPVGMLTFMERMASDDIRKPSLELGLFATHPQSNKRAQVIIGEIEKRGIKINRRLVTTYMAVQVKPVPDSLAPAVWIGDTEIIRLTDSGDEKASARADKIATKLTNVLLAGAKIRDVKLGEGNSILVLGQVVLTPTDTDAALAGTSVEKLAASVADAIKRAFFKEILQQAY